MMKSRQTEKSVDSLAENSVIRKYYILLWKERRYTENLG